MSNGALLGINITARNSSWPCVFNKIEETEFQRFWLTFLWSCCVVGNWLRQAAGDQVMSAFFHVICKACMMRTSTEKCLTARCSSQSLLSAL